MPDGPVVSPRRFFLLTAFLAVVALVLWILDVPDAVVIGGMASAWIVASVVEWRAARRRR